MKILIVGGGGREHAIAWAVAKSGRASYIYCAPGNGGIAEIAECVPIKATDIEKMLAFAKEKSIDLTIVAPDDPLAIGMVDAFQEAGLRAFGPTKAAAEIESSKVFAKELMKKYNIPTAGYQVFDDPDAAIRHLEGSEFPAVIKADGLALGKGVIIAQNVTEAKRAINEIMRDKKFGTSGNRVVIEDFLEGREVSVLVFTDGETIVPMPSAQDHKKVYDGDKGPNTGGMGAFSPSPAYTPEIADYCMENIFRPTIDAMRKEGRPFKGVLYFGLILTQKGVFVIEYNSRFGDPEAQAVLPLLDTNIVDVFEAVIDGHLDKINIKWKKKSAVCVILASGGYPAEYKKGYEITGLQEDWEEEEKGIIVFHSGTRLTDDKFYTDGGRVLGVTAVADTLSEARDQAYKEVNNIKFQDMIYRKDICAGIDE